MLLTVVRVVAIAGVVLVAVVLSALAASGQRQPVPVAPASSTAPHSVAGTPLGKIEPALLQRRDQRGPDALVGVAVLVELGPGETRLDLEAAARAALVASEADAAEAARRTGDPLQVADPARRVELTERLVADYRRRRRARASVAAVEPLAAELRRRGYAPSVWSDMPMIDVALPGRELDALAARPDVASVLLNESGEYRAHGPTVPGR